MHKVQVNLGAVQMLDSMKTLCSMSVTEQEGAPHSDKDILADIKLENLHPMMSKEDISH